MKKALIISSLLTFFFTNAQVGINTSNPRNTFHIDGAKDNALSGTPSVSQQANDVVVTSTGQVGIGTTVPSVKLDINNGTVNGAVKIVDGTQGDGKVFTSDANGVGTWKNSSVTNVNGVTPNTNTPYGVTADKYMNAYIDVPRGKWFVFLGFLVNGANAANTRYASRFSLSSSNTSVAEIGFTFLNGNKYVLSQASNGSAGADTYGLFSAGIIRVDVSVDSTRLYVWDVNTRGYGNTTSISINNNGENYLFAIKAN